MEKRVILLNGPSSSGKSALAKALQTLIEEKRGERFEIVSIDDYLPMSGTEPIFEDDVFAVNGSLCAGMLAALDASSGVILDHVITSERIFAQFREALKPHPITTVRVTCALAVLRQREAARQDRCPGSAEASDRYLYPKDGYDLTLDTGPWGAEETARNLYSALF